MVRNAGGGAGINSFVIPGEDCAQSPPVHRRSHFVPPPSRAPADWPGERGHVQPLLRKLFAGHRDLDAYIGGLKEMVDDVRRILKEEFGLDRRQIHYEKYD